MHLLRVAVLAAVFGGSATARAQEEVIDDPLAKAPPPAVATTSAPELHLDVWERTTIDTHWTRDDVAPALGEDVLRTWLRTELSARGGSPSSLRYALDVRLDLEARAKKGDATLLDRGTYLYDAVPLAAWVDAPIGERVRVRVGEQILSWGRLDLFSAADVLERRDLRVGPVIDPSWTRLPTPTVKLDATLGAFDLSLAWGVVSLPHRFEIAGSSWALLGPGVLTGYDARTALNRVAASTDASTFVRVQDALVQATGPAPRLDGGDLAARATAHLGGADLAFTYGFVHTKLPAVTLDSSLRDVLLTGGSLASEIALGTALNQGRSLLTTDYPRYHQFALDLEGTAGPLVLSWELGASTARPLYVSDPSGIPVPSDTPVVQGGLRAQYLRAGEGDDGLYFSAEIDGLAATRRSEVPWVLLGRRGAILAVLASARKVVRRHVVELGGLFTTSGPSLLVSGRYGYEISEGWTIGGGAMFFPRLREADVRDGLTLADVQVGRDYVELFARWRR